MVACSLILVLNVLLLLDQSIRVGFSTAETLLEVSSRACLYSNLFRVQLSAALIHKLRPVLAGLGLGLDLEPQSLGLGHQGLGSRLSTYSRPVETMENQITVESLECAY